MNAWVGCALVCLAGCGGRAVRSDVDVEVVPSNGGALETQPEAKAGEGGMGGGAPRAPNAPPCTAPIPLLEGTNTGLVRCAEGYIHRAEARSCPYRPRSAPLSPLSPADECARDSDCQGSASHCEPAWDYQHDQPYLACHPGCRTDSDCASDELCRCHEVAGDCLATACKTDAECAAGQHCLGTQPGSECFGEAFACSNADDECLFDADCTDPDRPLCLVTGAARRCSQRLFCG